MKNDIDFLFQRLRGKKKALIAYLSAGYPSFAEQTRHIEALVQGGIDLLELGIPFSDPVADGPTIQFASYQSLKRGTTLQKVLVWVKSIKRRFPIPIVFMSYLNPIYRGGLASFTKKAKEAGVSGLIVPDAIPEESVELQSLLKKEGLHNIYLVAPTTPMKRQKWIARKTGGFLYAVSVTGVTGARRQLPTETKRWLNQLRLVSPVPVCVGFGISGPEQIRHLKNQVDGFIVGSALIDLIRKNKPANRIQKLKRFVTALSKECRYGTGRN
ncbi:MAG: tryptophan synthase subunit alpha [Elusimicrobia bacterium]|nr:tryptophan synthase subunit alpha [Candidatus Obscuribacterium magneticum]